MKKLILTATVIVLVAGMIFILVKNRKRMMEETSRTAKEETGVPVSTYRVTVEPYSTEFNSNGVIQAVKELNFVSNVSGRVVSVMVEKGEVVGVGDTLLKIDSELLESDYRATLAEYESLKTDAGRFQRAQDAGGVTQQQLDNIGVRLAAAESRMVRSRRMLEDATVRSPLAGTINSRYVEPGSLIAPNAPLFDIVNDSLLKVTCGVSEYGLNLLSVGQRVAVTSSAVPDKTFAGTIGFIGIKTDRGLNYPVEVILDRDEELRIGMYVKVHFTQAEARPAILVPRRAILGSSGAAGVYIVQDGKAVRREVTLGDMTGDRIEVLQGLEPDDEIVVAGIMNIADGTEVIIQK